MIPYASDSDSGSVDLQLSNLENIKYTGKGGKNEGGGASLFKSSG